MVDEARAQRLAIDEARLAADLGVPVVPIVARTRQGLDQLRQTLADALRTPRTSPTPVTLPPLAERDVDVAGRRRAPRAAGAGRSHACVDHVGAALDRRRAARRAGRRAGRRPRGRRTSCDGRPLRDGRNLDLEIIGARYERVDRMVRQAVRPPDCAAATLDRPHRRACSRTGSPASSCSSLVMLALFQALFSWSEPAIALIERLVALAQGRRERGAAAGPLRDLLVDGVIAGVGNVIVFVPQIALLFLFIGVMEDAGYLARVAFVIDRVMGSVGLHGKSFVPMLSGFSCAVPAVMATRTLENRTDRLLTMMVLPLMSCSARLPIYVLVIATVFGPSARVGGVVSAGAVALFAMYALSVVAALTAAAVLRRTVLRGPSADAAARAAALPLAGRRRAGARDVAAGAVVSRRRRDDHPRADDRHVGAAQLPEARRSGAPTSARRCGPAWPDAWAI